MNFRKVEFDDCVRILASGFIHVRVLAGRIEYLYGVLPTTPLTDKGVADRLTDVVKNESIRGKVGSYQTVTAVETFFKYLIQEREFLSNPFLQTAETGRDYVLAHIQQAIEHFKNVNATFSSDTVAPFLLVPKYCQGILQCTQGEASRLWQRGLLLPERHPARADA